MRKNQIEPKKIILAIDVGNTSTSFGFYDGTRAIYIFTIFTKPYRSSDEYAILFENICRDKDINLSAIDGAIISSVVAPITEYIANGIRKIFGINPIIIGHGLKTGVNIRIDNHTQLGSDIVANIAAAEQLLEKPFAVIDLGTATTIAAVNAAGEMPGVIIIPGAGLAIDALAEKTAGLPFISLTPPKSLLGKNTIDSMASGCIYGTAVMIDGLIDKLKKELGTEKIDIISCGSLAEKIIPYCKNPIQISKNLTLDGINRIYMLNRRTKK